MKRGRHTRAAFKKDTPLTTFSELGLDPALLKALEQEGYSTPTPIQAQAIPSLLEGKDLLGIAQTGTGKTAAFALPILHRLVADRKAAPRNGARALILSPTRELATQIAESFKTYGRHLGLSVATIFGGVGFRPQAQALSRGIDILVATPGRLIDHMTERNAVLSSTEILVLDEADQMMDLGFIRPLRQIISKLPARRQSMFFSATMPHEIGALAAELLRDPVKVAVTPVAKTADRVEQKVIFVEAPKKRALLVELFADPAITRALVFTRTKRGADRVARHLEVAGIAVAAIHGNKSQGQREAALGAFKASRIRALIATDIAARGIDIDQVSHVFNYELPNIPESYVHRIGRTARAGAEGIAISLCDGEERAYLRDIERLTRQSIPSTDRRGDASLSVPADDRAPRDGAGRNDERRHGSNRGEGGAARRNPPHQHRSGHSEGATREGAQNRGHRSHGDRAHGDRTQGDGRRGHSGAEGRPNRGAPHAHGGRSEGRHTEASRAQGHGRPHGQAPGRNHNESHGQHRGASQGPRPTAQPRPAARPIEGSSRDRSESAGGAGLMGRVAFMANGRSRPSSPNRDQSRSAHAPRTGSGPRGAHQGHEGGRRGD